MAQPPAGVDAPVARESAAGDLRPTLHTAAIGDSRYEQSYSAILENRLRSVDGRRVRVVNAGVPSYTSFQGYYYSRDGQRRFV